ncbi:LexA family transcriptional regulator [Hoeflea sp.]|uniref:XRE family transcriptional regulator n=1 Tax=Hoeflea sp. TaxID=1940281 RepID=UPI0019960F71|nr:LexA family transcriptional regulator [Hoeflea sp.]MBC7282642.1 LexA family transcriptional regulator [Hoeflea sp.]
MANSAAMANRIREVRKSKHVTLEELAVQTGISTSYLSRIEAGNRGLSLENAVRIASALGCEVADFTSEFSVEDVAEAGRLDLTSARGIVGDVPNLTIHAGMGNGGLLTVEGDEAGIVPDTHTDGFWTFPDSIRAKFHKIGSVYALPVVGDSMEPTLVGGSIAFVDTSHRVPSPADIYAVDYGDGLMIKRIELMPRSARVKVISDNQRYGSYEMKRTDLNVYGRVIASFQWRG